MPAVELEPGFAEPRVRTVTLSTSATLPWLSRQLLGQWCREWELNSDDVDAAMTIVNELVTGAVAGGAHDVSLRAELGDGELLLAVASSVAEAATQVALADGDPRRLDIVRGLADSVEVRPGAQVWTVLVSVGLAATIEFEVGPPGASPTGPGGGTQVDRSR